jgi:putative acetyltransferase
LAPVIRPWREDDFDAVVGLWRRTKRVAYAFLPTESAHTEEDDRAFFRAEILLRCDVWLCETDGRPLGFLAMRGGYVDRLYVEPPEQRRGIGSALMAHALRVAPPGPIELHTHVANGPARAFYERLGFRAVEFGVSPPPESAPDVRYRLDRA